MSSSSTDTAAAAAPGPDNAAAPAPAPVQQMHLERFTTTGSPLQSIFVLDRVREYMGTTCDPKIRLVSRWFRDALAA
eukprot:CAMPEP_0173292092 /NCGR_PEP_ID=MMETSP1143-20121109/12529_1 /TAXON_ID=483371 /ORGANISM="non described non described, Strain CCMP2298" /LENGTH=76 /DNA_ID=CAMNT_0014231427 /DNA_START=708 /DNA_END=934 /DNA_ORIENTATION=+